MSFNQSRADKAEGHLRRPGRSSGSGQFRGGAGGGGGFAPPNHISSSSAGAAQPALSTNKSFKKSASGNGSQSMVNAASIVSGANATQNDSHAQVSRLSGLPEATDNVKPADISVPRNAAKAVPRASSSHAGGASGHFSLQFGTINPGIMNGMQIPARTSSAPPNLDEQKHNQVRHELHGAVSMVPISTAPKQQQKQQTKKDVGSSSQSNKGDPHPPIKSTMPVAPSPAPAVAPPQSSVHPMPGVRRPIPYQNQPPQVPLQFGRPNPLMQPPGLAANSPQIPMALPVGNIPQVRSQLLFPGHLLPQQALVQGSGMGFASPISHQLTPQLGNIGCIGMTSQYTQQQGKFVGGPRKSPVKITDPITHEEVKFDKKMDLTKDSISSCQRPPSNATPQSQAIAAYTPAHQMNYYPLHANNPSPFVFHTPTSVPLTTSQVPTNSQLPLYSYPSHQSGLPISFISPSMLTSASGGKPGPQTSLHSVSEAVNLESSPVSPPSAQVQGTSKPPPSTSHVPSITINVPVGKGEVPHILKSSTNDTSCHHGQSNTFPGSPTQQTVSSSDTLNVFEIEASQHVTLKSAEVFSSSDSTSIQKNIPPQAVSPLAPLIDRGYANNLVSSLVQDGMPMLSNKNNLLSDAAQTASVFISPISSLKEMLHVNQPLEKDGGTLEKSEKRELFDDAGGENEEIGISKEMVVSTFKDNNKLSIHNRLADISNTNSSYSSEFSCENFAKEEPSALNSTATEHKMPCIEGNETSKESVDSVAAQDSGSTKATEKVDLKVPEISFGVDVTQEKTSGDVSKVKTVSGYKKKKKKKEIYAKADASGNSDLYNAYKHTDEKNQVISSARSIDNSVAIDTHVSPLEGSRNFASEVEEDAQSKAELDDWEDAADISSPKLKAEENVHPSNGEMKQQDDDGNEAIDRKYSRDFLLTFAQHFTNLPIGFEIGSDVAEALMSIPLGKSHVDRESYPSPGRITDRLSGSRVDRRMVGMMDDDKWAKSTGSFGRDLRLEVGHGISVNLRPGQGVNPGGLRNSRAQSPNHFGGGLMQSGASQGGISRNSSDADRWQRGSQRGLISSPQTPLQVMHKAEKKYEVGKVTDEEQAKQRQLKGILNKLTPQNFEKLFALVIEVNIDNAVTLTGVISQIFDKALMEPTFCEMYANFCFHLAGALPEISEDNEKITFKRLLLNKCQEEFERGEREQAEASRNEEEGEIKQSKEEREEKRIQARRRMLGNIRLIGELYKKKMLTERIMHECIKKLLGQYQNPDEEDVEALCKLMSTIGEIIDHSKAKEHMDAYFEVMLNLSTDQKLSSRVRFMLKDAIDLRKNKWQQRRKVEGPKKIEEVHRDAAQERHAQSSRLSRAPVVNSGSRSFRGSAPLTSPSSQQIGVIRGLPSQLRGYGSKDIRFEDRHQFENRTLSHPLPQRSIDDNSITLGPRGGLATGILTRQPLILHDPASEISQNVVDRRRVVTHQNGHNALPDVPSHNAHEDAAAKYVADRFSGTKHEQPSPQDDRAYPMSRDSRVPDRTFDRSSTTILPAGRTYGSLGSSPVASETKSCSEDVLREKSMSTIKEFYSAKDEGEVALCIKELNAPSFYPLMLSLWITDSFERKDMHRDMLANLIVNLCKSHDGLVSQLQLIQGFEQVLFSLEDAVNDAPRAAEFLGRFFAKVIMENVVPFRDIGRLIHEGGEEPGRLREVGLAEDVLANILESIKLEKGDAVLNEFRSSSSLILEDFRPPHSKQSKLDAFL